MASRLMVVLTSSPMIPVRRCSLALQWGNRMLPCFGVQLAFLVTLFVTAAAEPEPQAADPDLPQPLDALALQRSLTTSPFNRVVDYSNTLMLTGVASVNGKPIATLMDRTTKQRYVVSEEPNAKGWRLAGVSGADAIKEASVQLDVGGETVTLHYTPPATPTPSVTKNSNYGPSHLPTEQEFTGHDENGKAYVRGSVYLSDADRDRYHNGISREAHDEFRQIIRDNRDKMFNYSPEQRTSFAKKVLDHVEAKHPKN
jgi:hypothetical protein